MTNLDLDKNCDKLRRGAHLDIVHQHLRLQHECLALVLVPAPGWAAVVGASPCAAVQQAHQAVLLPGPHVASSKRSGRRPAPDPGLGFRLKRWWTAAGCRSMGQQRIRAAARALSRTHMTATAALHAQAHLDASTGHQRHEL